ncbi:hypothetical protein LXL04_022509 [Taraxacum kok-saghyz]
MKNDYGQRFNVSNCYALALFSFPSSSQSSASTSSTPATSTSTGDFTGALSLSYPSYLPVKAPRCRPLETPSKPTSGNTLESAMTFVNNTQDLLCFHSTCVVQPMATSNKSTGAMEEGNQAMKLYSHPMSSCSRRVRLALNLKGLENCSFVSNQDACEISLLLSAQRVVADFVPVKISRSMISPRPSTKVLRAIKNKLLLMFSPKVNCIDGSGRQTSFQEREKL